MPLNSIDELVSAEGEPLLPEAQLGGGGFYAIMGARLWLESAAVGLIVGRGYDFPSPVQEKLDSYGPCWAYRDYPAERTFRARTTLSGTKRTFEALGKRIWQAPRDLALVGYGAPAFLHLVCSPQQAADFLHELHDMGNGWDRTRIIFEPMPADCTPENLEALKAVLPDIEVFSPNEEEAARFLGMQLPETTDERRAAIQDVACRMRALGAKKHIVIRSGALGACIDSTEGGCCWIPAYHGSTEKIVDFTGAGNAFLGGLASGLGLTMGSADIVSAAMRGAVSASYMLEQYGPPRLERAEGDSPQDRFNELSGRFHHRL